MLFTLRDIGLWLAYNSIIFLITSEFFYLYNDMHIDIEKKMLRWIAIIFGLFFIIFVINEVYSILITL